jgi:hypothetical protein
MAKKRYAAFSSMLESLKDGQSSSMPQEMSCCCLLIHVGVIERRSWQDQGKARNVAAFSSMLESLNEWHNFPPFGVIALI